MQDKEKQITEMAIELIHGVGNWLHLWQAKSIVNILLVSGWEKLPENSVVYTMDEHAKLVSQVRQEFEAEYKDKVVLSKKEYGDKLMESYKRGIEYGKEIASKETAGKIIEIIKRYVPPKSGLELEIARDFGVEIGGEK